MEDGRERERDRNLRREEGRVGEGEMRGRRDSLWEKRRGKLIGVYIGVCNLWCCYH